MDIGVVKEIKPQEYRVAATPGTVQALVAAGHRVHVERGAGLGSGFTDEEYASAGARAGVSTEEAWGQRLVLKVKEPVASEFRYLRDDMVIFTYLHLAADRPLTEALLKAGTTAIAYETVQLPNGSLPLLTPMSEVAGRMATQVGAHLLERAQGGRGVLLGGVPGVKAAKVVVIGAGEAGLNATEIALGMQADVWVLDKNITRLQAVDRIHRGHATTISSNLFEVAKAVSDADLVIGAVLVPGAKAPKLVSNELV